MGGAVAPDHFRPDRERPFMTTRRFSAILAADIASFSGDDGARRGRSGPRIRALRKDVIEPALARHHGRLVKTTGDGFLAEFARPVEAVRSGLASSGPACFR